MIDDHKPFSHSADPYGAKANFDVKEKKLHTHGFPSFWSETLDLLILVGIIAIVIVLFKVFL